MALSTSFLSESDELETIVADINKAQWDVANDIAVFEPESLRFYLQQQDNLFAVCYVGEGAERVFAGLASARVQYKPYEKARWLYVDEVDTAVNLRKRGVGTALMNLLLEYAANNELVEVWLGTEPDNEAANKLYQSLEPDDVEKFVGYTYELE